MTNTPARGWPGMRASLSTRLGTALRHAGQALATRRARRKLLLVVTDGEPSDIDVTTRNTCCSTPNRRRSAIVDRA